MVLTLYKKRTRRQEKEGVTALRCHWQKTREKERVNSICRHQVTRHPFFCLLICLQGVSLQGNTLKKLGENEYYSIKIETTVVEAIIKGLLVLT